MILTTLVLVLGVKNIGLVSRSSELSSSVLSSHEGVLLSPDPKTKVRRTIMPFPEDWLWVPGDEFCIPEELVGFTDAGYWVPDAGYWFPDGAFCIPYDVACFPDDMICFPEDAFFFPE